VLVATLGGLLFGWDTSVVNGALDSLGRTFDLTPLVEGVVVSAVLVGAAVGALVTGRVSDAVGRRRTLRALAVVFVVASVACALAPSVAVLAVARAVLGLAVGGVSVTVPVYLSELAPVERRGRLVGRNELMLVGGQLAAFVVNAVVGTLWGGDDGVWRIMFGVAVLPAVAFLVGATRLPESPRWLLAQGRDDEAAAVLRQVRGDARAAAELQEVRAQGTGRDRSPRPRLRHLVAEPWLRRVLVVGVGLAVAQQLTGINSIMYYGTQVLQESGFSQQGALVANVGAGVVAVLAMLVALRVIDRVGRRTMLLVGFAGVTAFHLMIGAASLVLPPGTTRAVVVLVLVVGFVGTMQGTIGPLTWLVLSEIFPSRLRGLGTGVTVLVLWSTNVAVSLGFPVVVDRVGISTTFFGFAVLAAASLAFVATRVPETAGRTLEQLERELGGHA